MLKCRCLCRRARPHPNRKTRNAGTGGRGDVLVEVRPTHVFAPRDYVISAENWCELVRIVSAM